MNLTDRQLQRLRILACPDSYVSSLFDTDRAAVRAAIGEIARLNTELAVALDHDKLALEHHGMTEEFGRWGCDVVDAMADTIKGLRRDVERLKAEVDRFRAALANVREMAEADIGFGRADDGTLWIFRIRDDARAALREDGPQ